MQSTKEKIVSLGDKFIRDKGYNGFSYYDIAPALRMNNAAIHYHFPAKSNLGEAIVDHHIEKFKNFSQSLAGQPESIQLKRFLDLFHEIKDDDKVCLVGALAPDLPTLDARMRQKLNVFVEAMLAWLTNLLEQGRKHGEFTFFGTARTRALLVTTNIFGSVQIARITGEKDFRAVKTAIIKDLS